MTGSGDLAIGRVLAVKYLVQRLIARGGTSGIYLASDLVLGRDVAIKHLHQQGSDPSLRRRFFLEASTCARIAHRHIVTVHDYGEGENGELFIAMEHLRGEPLSRVIAAEIRLPWQRACEIAAQIARALRAAHKLGVVHRDLKPGNVMLVRDDLSADDFVKLLDFGLVKVVGANEHLSEGAAATWVGTPRYMAPEQIRCSAVDARADIYSFGAILFHLLSGRPPFSGQTVFEVFTQHLREVVPSIASISGVNDVPSELERIVRRCLEKQASERFSSMNDVLSALDAVVGSRLCVAWSPDFSPRRPRSARRIWGGQS